jgi:hypothetical protein
VTGGVFGEVPGRIPRSDGDQRELVIPNVFEFCRTFMDRGFSCAHRLAWEAGALPISECSLFWGGGDKLVLLPLGPDPRWVEDVREAMGYPSLETFHPSSRLGGLCRAAQSEKLQEALGGGRRPAKALPWGATPELYALADFLGGESRLLGGEVTARENLFEALNLDSKAGFRLAASFPDSGVSMPEGFIAPTLSDALDILPFFAKRGGGVLKASHGAGGTSVALFPAGMGFSPEAAKRAMEARSRWDPFWLQSPVIVEELAGSGEAAPAFTADFFIGEGVRPRLIGAGRMRIAAGTRYCGLVAGAGALEREVMAAVGKAGEKIGRLLAGKGVRGWFNADFISDSGGTLLVAEVNVRRSSATHGFEAARFLYGEEWPDKVALLVNERFSFSGGKPDYPALRRGFASYNREARGRGAWAVPTSVNGGLRQRTPRISFLLLAPHARDLPLEEKLLTARLERETGKRCSSPPLPEPRG